MKIKINDYKGKTVVIISGDIDMYSSPDLREQLMVYIGKKTAFLSVDFTMVSYIDSSGIATFVEGLKCMKAYGGRLQFFGIPQGILEIFRFSKLDNVFEMYGTIEDAVNS